MERTKIFWNSLKPQRTGAYRMIRSSGFWRGAAGLGMQYMKPWQRTTKSSLA